MAQGTTAPILPGLCLKTLRYGTCPGKSKWLCFWVVEGPRAGCDQRGRAEGLGPASGCTQRLRAGRMLRTAARYFRSTVQWGGCCGWLVGQSSSCGTTEPRSDVTLVLPEHQAPRSVTSPQGPWNACPVLTIGSKPALSLVAFQARLCVVSQIWCSITVLWMREWINVWTNEFHDYHGPQPILPSAAIQGHFLQEALPEFSCSPFSRCLQCWECDQCIHASPSVKNQKVFLMFSVVPHSS